MRRQNPTKYIEQLLVLYILTGYVLLIYTIPKITYSQVKILLPRVFKRAVGEATCQQFLLFDINSNANINNQVLNLQDDKTQYPNCYVTRDVFKTQILSGIVGRFNQDLVFETLDTDGDGVLRWPEIASDYPGTTGQRVGQWKISGVIELVQRKV